MREFDDWYSRVRPRMYPALAAWCGDPSVAADALDDAFVRALERWNRVARMDSPEGWLWRTAANAIRRRTRRLVRETQHWRRHAQGATDVVLDPAGFDVDLVRALQMLTERQRTAVVLRYVADLPEKEVAEMMSIAPGTVSATIHQARQRLIEVLADPTEPSASPNAGPMERRP